MTLIYAIAVGLVLFLSIFLHELWHYVMAKKLWYKPTKFHFFTLPTIDKKPGSKFLNNIVKAYNKVINTLTIKKDYKGLSIGVWLIPMPIAFVDLGKNENQIPRKDLFLIAIAWPLANIFLFFILWIWGLFWVQYFTNLPKIDNNYTLVNSVKGYSVDLKWDWSYKELKSMFNTSKPVTVELIDWTTINTIWDETLVIPKYSKYPNSTFSDKISSILSFAKNELITIIELSIDASWKTIYYKDGEAVSTIKSAFENQSPLTIGVVQFTAITWEQTQEIISEQKNALNNSSLLVDIVYMILFTSILNIMLAFTNLLPIPATDGFMISISLISIIYSFIGYVISKNKIWKEPEMRIAWKLSMWVFILFIFLISIQIISDIIFIISSII